MKIAKSIEEVRSFVASQKKSGKTIGFVPTMGALHNGHLSLIAESKKNNSVSVMSIFVNPTQFGPNEDFSKYPRPIENDQKLAESAGTDLLFLPTPEMIYPASTFSIRETEISKVMCGKFRPGHFDGVCTVVAKLLHIVNPDKLYLGQKDAQQLRIIQTMVEQLFFSVDVVGVPTLREKNGLAMSSRNQFLSASEKEKAAVIYKALSSTLEQFKQGERKTKNLLHHAKEILQTEPSLNIQYLDLRTWKNFQEVDEIHERCLLATACFMGSTRLIDNIFLD